jgi:hypothetical protein
VDVCLAVLLWWELCVGLMLLFGYAGECCRVCRRSGRRAACICHFAAFQSPVVVCTAAVGVVSQMPLLPRDLGSFHCSLPRLMPLAAIDPSLAIGFFCADAGAWLAAGLLSNGNTRCAWCGWLRMLDKLCQALCRL